MFDLTSLFISVAHAADAVAPAAVPTAEELAASQGGMIRFLPLFLIFAVFYFLIIRPQQKKLDEQKKMMNDLKKGDKVYIGSGLVGTISKLEDDRFVMVEIAKDVQVKTLRAAITGMVTEPKAVEKKD